MAESVEAFRAAPESSAAACSAHPRAQLRRHAASDNELPEAGARHDAIRTTDHADSDPTWTGPTISSFADVSALISEPGES
jgi:putative hydrolase of the HAD superfamily